MKQGKTFSRPRSIGGRTAPRLKRSRHALFGGARAALGGVALFLLVAFAAGLVSAAADEILRSTPPGESASHADGSQCPDSSDDGQPCSHACPCTCCPGHAPNAASAVQHFKLGCPNASDRTLHAGEILRPEDVPSPTFHPPRA